MTSLKRDNIELEPEPLSARRMITMTLLAVALVILPSTLTDKRINVDLPFGTVETKRLDFQLGIAQLDKIVPETAPEPPQAPVVAEVVETPPPVVQEPVAPVMPVEQPKPIVKPKPIPKGSAKDYIYLKESTHTLAAVNRSSGACGLGQSLPCSKMANVCPNWRTDYDCQDRWFTQYMLNRYGSWEKARAFHVLKGWW
jgi:hypothetical protein